MKDYGNSIDRQIAEANELIEARRSRQPQGILKNGTSRSNSRNIVHDRSLSKSSNKRVSYYETSNFPTPAGGSPLRYSAVNDAKLQRAETPFWGDPASPEAY